jgi:hypothetical protein
MTHPQPTTKLEEILGPIFKELLSNRETVTWEMSTDIKAGLKEDEKLTKQELKTATQAIQQLLTEARIDELNRLMEDDSMNNVLDRLKGLEGTEE